MKKFTINLKMWAFASICLVFFAFSPTDLPEEQIVYVQKKLGDHYDKEQDGAEIAYHEFNITNSGFCRYKRHFTDGKIEYFSFNLNKFKDLDYYGTVKNGKMYLRTLGDNVIVQTYNDKQDDIDSMGSYIAIPIKDIEPDDLIDLSEKFHQMNLSLKK